MDAEHRGENFYGKKIFISLRLNGRVLAEVELSPIEYEEIRLQPPEEAVRKISKKDPGLSSDERMVSEIMRYLKAGQYIVRVAKERRKGNESE